MSCLFHYSCHSMTFSQVPRQLISSYLQALSFIAHTHPVTYSAVFWVHMQIIFQIH